MDKQMVSKYSKMCVVESKQLAYGYEVLYNDFIFSACLKIFIVKCWGKIIQNCNHNKGDSKLHWEKTQPGWKVVLSLIPGTQRV